VYDLNELAKYAFSSDEEVVAQCKNTNNSPILWNNESLKRSGGLSAFNYKDYMNNDSTLKECFVALKQYGAILVDGVGINNIFNLLLSKLKPFLKFRYQPNKPK
jgi:hypothetical protein